MPVIKYMYFYWNHEKLHKLHAVDFFVPFSQRFDIFPPQWSQIHVVKEARLYPSWNDNATLKDRSEVNFNTGIIAAKRALNELHQSLGQQGYTQVKNMLAVKNH